MPDIAEALIWGGRVIAVVGGDQYVVITGIDERSIYLNNPITVANRQLATLSSIVGGRQPLFN